MEKKDYMAVIQMNDDVGKNDASAATEKQHRKRYGWNKLKIGWVFALIFFCLFVYFWIQNGRLSTENAGLKERVKSLAKSDCFQKSTNGEPFEQPQSATINNLKAGITSKSPKSEFNSKAPAYNYKTNASEFEKVPEEIRNHANLPILREH